jgi:hypothetical protein
MKCTVSFLKASFHFHHNCTVYNFSSRLTNPDRLTTNVCRDYGTENSTTKRINLFPFSVCKEDLVAQTAALNGRSGG